MGCEGGYESYSAVSTVEDARPAKALGCIEFGTVHVVVNCWQCTGATDCMLSPPVPRSCT